MTIQAKHWKEQTPSLFSETWAEVLKILGGKIDFPSLSWSKEFSCTELQVWKMFKVFFFFPFSWMISKFLVWWRNTPLAASGGFPDGLASLTFPVTHFKQDRWTRSFSSVNICESQTHKSLCLDSSCPRCVKRDPAPGWGGVRCISKNSWEGLEKLNPSCGTAGCFCELLFTLCWTSHFIYFHVVHLKQGPIHPCVGLELHFFHTIPHFATLMIM